MLMLAHAIVSQAIVGAPLAARDHRLGSSSKLHPLACRTILVVEYRDEVAARLMADLTAMAIRVQRATGAAEASRCCASFPADLLLVNVDLPDGSGWLLTMKLRLFAPTPRIWLYAAAPSPKDRAFAEFVEADGLIDYRGDVWRLSAEVISRLSVLPAIRAVARTASRCA
jgi:response regulator RpfG family c-di-GMP phosphodiesterase